MKSKMVRLNEMEVEKVRQKCIELNKKLIRLDKEPFKDSELVHVLLDLALKNVYISKNGDIEI